MDGPAALRLIKQVGIYDLCGTDGCLCMNFEIQGVHVDISCRKSDGGMMKIAPDFHGIKLRVHSRHQDERGDELVRIAREIVEQLKPSGYAVMARFCDQRHDYEGLCIYCDKPRTDPAGYLCDDCLSGRTEHLDPAQRDYRKSDFKTEECFEETD